jgi:TRAP transporter TAXI family solute receptor
MRRVSGMVLLGARLAQLLLLTILTWPAGGEAREDSYRPNIMTGGPKGTYIQFGRDIRDLALSCQIDINVLESEGSLTNIYAVHEKPATPFGIVQSDALEYMLSFVKSDRDIKSIVARSGVVFPLYDEEVHVLARAGAESLEDLNERRVGVGSAGSGTNLTATTILGIAQVSVKERMLSELDALKALRANDLDAFFYVAGAPTDLFLREVTAEDNVSLVPITSPSLLDYYQPVKIAKETYPWLKNDVDTIAVKAVLMTYDFDPAGSSYQRRSCATVSEVTYLIAHNLQQLRAQGHRKWSDVRLDDLPQGWKQTRCVQLGLAADYRPRCASDPAPDRCESIENPVVRQLCKGRAMRSK